MSSEGSGFMFQNRKEAGQNLAEELQAERFKNSRVIAIPRGGVPIGYEIARSLHVPLDILVVRRMGAPGHPGYGIGAITEERTYWLSFHSMDQFHISPKILQKMIQREYKEIKRRSYLYRQGRPMIDLIGKTVILVDDGLATGGSALVAIRLLRAKGAAKVILAVPVCTRQNAQVLRPELDDLICLESPEQFFAIGLWYEDFARTSDEEVLQLLFQAKEREMADVHLGFGRRKTG